MEFDLIARIRAREMTREDVVLGIGDDAALVSVPSGMQLAIAMDTLNAGVHFPHGTHASHIGWKALAVNLSDLAAMGAQPAWCTLSLSLPDADTAWIDAFLDGFLELAAQHEVALIGGDTTRGPLSVCVAVHGFVEPHTALRRDGAQVGDDVWVSGTLGDAAAGLAIALADMASPATSSRASGAPLPSETTVGAHEHLRQRLDRPTPRLALGRALRGHAHACIDISDGLLADVAHVASASRVGIEIDIDTLPASDALVARIDGVAARQGLQASGGDDYELLFTAAPAMRTAIEALADGMALQLTRVGRVRAGVGVVARHADGTQWHADRRGYQHFDSTPQAPADTGG